MGKVTGMLYASIYVVLCGMALAAGFNAETFAWCLWGLAVLMLAALCVFGYRLDALAGESEPMGSAWSGRETMFATNKDPRGKVRRAA